MRQPMPPLWSVTLTVDAACSDALGDVLGEEAVALSVLAPPRHTMATVEAIFAAPPDTAQLTARLAVVAMLHGIALPKIEIRSVPKLDWLKKVATDFPPVPVARWLIHGATHKPAAGHPRHKLKIDATSAFGTGEHPTTRGCLIMLDRVLKKEKIYNMPRNMLDMGCGTGILAMAFAQATHGRAHVRSLGVDMDDVSVVIARANARENGVAKNLRVVTGQGYRHRLVKSTAPYDVIMANIFARPLAHMAKDVRRTLKPGGTLILAGLLNSQANMVIAAHRAQGIYVTQRLVLGEWTILALRRTCLKAAKAFMKKGS